MLLPPHYVETGILLFERSLARVRKSYPEAKIDVVYLPSPHIIYPTKMEDASKTTIKVEPEFGINHKIEVTIEASAVWRMSNKLCKDIESVSSKLGTGFLDVRPGIQDAAKIRPVHGPADWSHFNRLGYTRLGKIVAEFIRGSPEYTKCGELLPPRNPQK